MPKGRLSDIEEIGVGRLSDIEEEPPSLNAPPSVGDMVHGVLEPISRMTPDVIKRFGTHLGAEWNRPIVGPITQGDVILGGPLGGMALGAAGAGVRAGLRLLRRAKPIASAIAPTGINPAMKAVEAWRPSRLASMRDLVQPAPQSAVADAVSAARTAGDIPAVSLEASSSTMAKPRVLATDFLRGQRDLAAIKANPPSTWPASKSSSRNVSEVPGLTKSDVEYLTLKGFDVSQPPTPQALEALIQGRVLRTAAHRTGAEQGAQRVLDRLRDDSGSIPAGLLRTLGGASVGGVVGATQNPDEPAVGGAAGAAFGAAAANPMTTLRALNQLRHVSMLSGLAPAKSLINDIGAPFNAAWEMRSMRPITELLRLPTNIKNYAVAFKEGTPYRGVEHPISKFNIFARQMGAADQASRAVLERGGAQVADANRLLNQTPLDELGVSGATAKVLRGAGSIAYPYTRNAFNQFVHGFMPRSKSLAGLYGGLGLAAGDNTDNPVSLGLLSAFAGPYALPFLGGAALASGKASLFGQASPLPEFGLEQLAKNPLRQFEPALFRYIGQ